MEYYIDMIISKNILLEQIVGFEPTNKGFADLSLKPLEYICILWMQRKDLNPRPSGYEPDKLPLLHSALFNFEYPKTFSFKTNDIL